jgi:hypothetical protein
MSALELVCLYMTDANSGPWATKDLRTLASLQATCKEAHSIRDGFIDERKSMAIRNGFIDDRKFVDKAHKVNMRKLKRHITGYICEARDISDSKDQSKFVNPFSGEFDYTDHGGAWWDDARGKYGDYYTLTVEEIEERDRMVRDNPVPLSMTHLVHHGLQHYDPPWVPP